MPDTTTEARENELTISQLIEERDQAHEAADQLSEAVAELLGLEIGEHSNVSVPWLTALVGVQRAIAAQRYPAAGMGDVRDRAVDAAMAVFERSLRLMTPHRHLVVEALDAAREMFDAEMTGRMAAAHDALTRIDDGDDDAYNTLESTVEYVVGRYRRVAESEEQAADEIVRLRAELTAVADLAYRAGSGPAAADALAEIQTRARRALQVAQAALNADAADVLRVGHLP